jgi:hypothetical protein
VAYEALLRHAFEKHMVNFQYHWQQNILTYADAQTLIR